MKFENGLPSQIRQKFALSERLDIPSSKGHSYFLLRKVGKSVADEAFFLKTVPAHRLRTDILQKISDGSLSQQLNLPELFFIEDNRGFSLSQFRPNGDFRRFLNEERNSQPCVNQVRQFVKSIHNALCDLHSNCSVVHGDIKPSNILLSENTPDDFGGVRLNDFDNCVVVNSPGVELKDKTPSYAAPERLNSRIPATPASDYWSLGLVLYEWATGEHPFGTLEDAEINRRLSGNPSIPFGLIEDFEIRALIAGLLQKDLGERFAETHVSRWLEAEPAVITEGLGLAGERSTDTPYALNSRSIVSHQSLGQELLKSGDASVLSDPELRNWLTVSLQRPDIVSRIDELTQSQTPTQLALHELAYELWPDMPPLWQGQEINLHNMLKACVDVHEGENQQQREWLNSIIRDEPVINFFLSKNASPRFSNAINILNTVQEGIRDYEASWENIINAGAPPEIRENQARQDAEIATLVRFLLDEKLISQVDALRADLFDYRVLLFRQDWFYTFGVSEDLSIPKLMILNQLDQVSFLETHLINDAADLEAINQNTFSDSIILFRSQQRLAANTRLLPGAEFTERQSGGIYREEKQFSFWQSINDELIQPIWATLSYISDWIGRRLNPAAATIDENIPAEDETAGEDATEPPFRVRIAPLTSTFISPEVTPEVNLYLLRISWRADRNNRVKLVLNASRGLFSKRILQLNQLPHRGHIVLTVCESCKVRILEKRGFFTVRRHEPVRMYFRRTEEKFIDIKDFSHSKIEPLIPPAKMKYKDIEALLEIKEKLVEPRSLSKDVQAFSTVNYTWRDKIRFYKLMKLAKAHRE